MIFKVRRNPASRASRINANRTNDSPIAGHFPNSKNSMRTIQIFHFISGVFIIADRTMRTPFAVVMARFLLNEPRLVYFIKTGIA